LALKSVPRAMGTRASLSVLTGGLEGLKVARALAGSRPAITPPAARSLTEDSSEASRWSAEEALSSAATLVQPILESWSAWTLTPSPRCLAEVSIILDSSGLKAPSSQKTSTNLASLREATRGTSSRAKDLT